MKKVLVGVDGSKTSLAAARWAARLAAAVDADLIAVNAWQPDQAELSPETLAELRGDAQARLDGWIAPLRGDVRFRTELLEGDREVLEEALATEDADLLVVGTHGETGFTPARFGSFTGHLARHVRRPLALIPDPADDDALTDAPIGAIAVLVDESAGTEAAVRFCTRLAAAFDASVIALTTEDPEEADEDLERWTAPLRTAGIEVSTLVRDHVDPEEGLVDLAGRVQLVVAGAEGLSSVLGLRLGGTAMHLLEQTRVPMVIVPPGTSTGPREHHRPVPAPGGGA